MTPINGQADATLTLEAFLGATPIGSVSALGAIPPGFPFPGGPINASFGAFDRVRSTSSGRDFAVDNITVRASQAVPEPASLVLLGAGVAFASRRASLR